MSHNAAFCQNGAPLPRSRLVTHAWWAFGIQSSVKEVRQTSMHSAPPETAAQTSTAVYGSGREGSASPKIRPTSPSTAVIFSPCAKGKGATEQGGGDRGAESKL